jgi:phospholipid-transporting ATPase
MAAARRGCCAPLRGRAPTGPRVVHFTAVGDGATFCPNKIRTAKYTLLTFLPLNLFEQFHRVAYAYFLLIVVLNQIPELEAVDKTASLIPLLVVLAATGIKDAWADWRRHQADHHENRKKVRLLRRAGLEGGGRDIAWEEVQVGDWIEVEVDSSVPADMVVTHSSDEDGGTVYVDTCSLDGETNLKVRTAVDELAAAVAARGPPAGGGAPAMRYEQPNVAMYAFSGTLDEGSGGRPVPLRPSNVVLRSCTIRNTAWVRGVAIYTGHETKATRHRIRLGCARPCYAMRCYATLCDAVRCDAVRR